MKLDNPRNTRRGCVHQTSGRIVCPNERRGMLTSAPFICRQLLHLRNLPFSTLPNFPAHSKDCRNLPPSKYLRQCSRDNRFRSKPQLACAIQFTPPLSQPWQKNVTRTGNVPVLPFPRGTDIDNLQTCS